MILFLLQNEQAPEQPGHIEFCEIYEGTHNLKVTLDGLASNHKFIVSYLNQFFLCLLYFYSDSIFP